MKFDEKKEVATVTFFNNLPNNKDYAIELKAGEVVAKGEFKVAITEAASISLNEMIIPAASATPIDYKVLDANGVDITESSTVTFNSTKTNAISGKNITLADNEVAFVQAELTKKDGSKLQSKQVRIIAQGAKAVTLDKFTVGNTGVDFSASDYKQSTFITEDSSNKFVQVQVKDQYGKVASKTGVEYESLNKDVALVDRVTGAVTPIKPGKVDVRVKVGDVNQVVTFEVGAKAVAKTLEVSKTNVQLSLAAATETLDIVVKDQYGNEFSSAGVTAVSKDTTVATAQINNGKLVVTGLKAGSAVVEVKLGELTSNVVVEVKQPTTVASYKLEGFEKQLDKFAGKDNKNVTSMDLKVAGYDANGVKAESNVDATYSVTDKDGKVVANAVNKGTISATNLTAGGTYTLTAKVGTITIASETFKVVDTEVKPVFKLVKDAITVDKSKELISDLNSNNSAAIEVSKDGVTYAKAQVTKLKFTSDNSSIVESSPTTALGTVNLKADGKVSILLSELTVDLDGDLKTTADVVTITSSSLLDVNVKTYSLELAAAKDAAKTKIEAAEKSVTASKTTADNAVKTAEEAQKTLAPDASTEEKAAAQKAVDDAKTLQTKVDAEVAKVTAAKAVYAGKTTVADVEAQVKIAEDAAKAAAELVK